jgi:hypothetical protein
MQITKELKRVENPLKCEAFQCKSHFFTDSNMENEVKLILVTGGVMSGVGKGIISSSLGDF